MSQSQYTQKLKSQERAEIEDQIESSHTSDSDDSTRKSWIMSAFYGFLVGLTMMFLTPLGLSEVGATASIMWMIGLTAFMFVFTLPIHVGRYAISENTTHLQVLFVLSLVPSLIAGLYLILMM